MIQVLKDMPKSNGIQSGERWRLVIKLALVKAVREPVPAMPFYVHGVTRPLTRCERFQEFSAAATHIQDSAVLYKTLHNSLPARIQPQRRGDLACQFGIRTLLIAVINIGIVVPDLALRDPGRQEIHATSGTVSLPEFTSQTAEQIVLSKRRHSFGMTDWAGGYLQIRAGSTKQRMFGRF